MATHSFFGIIFCTLFVSQIFGYPYNDISIACDSMLPDHGSSPQTSSPPYVISVAFERYDPGNEIQVVLEGTSSSGFIAFMIQAREIDGNVPVGTFRIVDPNTQGLPCADRTNSAVSHNNPIRKHRIKTFWVAPQGTKRIRIMGTFVQDYGNYWVGIHSKTLSPRDVDTNEFMATNRSMLTNDSIASIVSEILAGSDTFSDNDEDIDLNVLIADSEEEYVSNATVGSQNLDRRNTARKSRRKNPQESSQTDDSQSKVLVVKQGNSKGSGCIGDGVPSVYNKYGCRDREADSSDQPSHGQMEI
ncbi:ferric-chelate reductase 1-like isoform X2 [Ahaetulla prasina]|uniref:ferric-chelate reductase 1-like isoform X2 n=1 Tax=Ahaetulla prasina TaxID=499056 RepID=UPI002647F0D4|nr:ferric-chelate reductase 1-like isoform X2 [Ahaetulla prasina]